MDASAVEAIGNALANRDLAVAKGAAEATVKAVAEAMWAELQKQNQAQLPARDQMVADAVADYYQKHLQATIQAVSEHYEKRIAAIQTAGKIESVDIARLMECHRQLLRELEKGRGEQKIQILRDSKGNITGAVREAS
jgi:hypothetical protein